MHSIESIDLLAAVHLLLVGGLLACGILEIVFEYHALFFDRSLHHGAIQFHYWIDIVVEIPLIIGLSLTGILMVVLLQEFTPLHYLKIGSSILVVSGYVACFAATFRRRRLLKEGATEDELIELTKGLMVRNVAIIAVLATVVVATGFWLSYHRIFGTLGS